MKIAKSRLDFKVQRGNYMVNFDVVFYNTS